MFGRKKECAGCKALENKLARAQKDLHAARELERRKAARHEMDAYLDALDRFRPRVRCSMCGLNAVHEVRVTSRQFGWKTLLKSFYTACILERACNRCGNVWNEKPLTTKVT